MAALLSGISMIFYIFVYRLPYKNMQPFIHAYAGVIYTPKDTYIIGIDRGERNLLYVSVIDTDGNIVEQKSLNIINNVDYQAKLKQVEIMRKLARQNWKQGVKIADLKKGYLSQAVHEVAMVLLSWKT